MLANNQHIIANTIAKRDAFQNHHTLNQSMRLLVNKIISTVIIQLTNHRVIQLSGTVRIRSIQPTVVFNNAITTPTTIARQKLATSTHGMIYADSVTAAQIKTNCIIIFINIF